MPVNNKLYQKVTDNKLLERKGVPYRKTIMEDAAEFPYNGKSMYKGGYQSDKAKEIYTPDETGHMKSVDYRTGIWLKDKDYPTAWKELMQTQLNTSLSKELGHPVLNEDGRLEYPGGYNNKISYIEWLKRNKK